MRMKKTVKTVNEAHGLVVPEVKLVVGME